MDRFENDLTGFVFWQMVNYGSLSYYPVQLVSAVFFEFVNWQYDWRGL